MFITKLVDILITCHHSRFDMPIATINQLLSTNWKLCHYNFPFSWCGSVSYIRPPYTGFI